MLFFSFPFSCFSSLKLDNVLNPAFPLALRLRGHLLLGIVRIYQKKVKFLWTDCTDALSKIKLAFKSTQVDLPSKALRGTTQQIDVQGFGDEDVDLSLMAMPFELDELDGEEEEWRSVLSSQVGRLRQRFSSSHNPSSESGSDIRSQTSSLPLYQLRTPEGDFLEASPMIGNSDSRRMSEVEGGRGEQYEEALLGPNSRMSLSGMMMMMEDDEHSGLLGAMVDQDDDLDDILPGLDESAGLHGSGSDMNILALMRGDGDNEDDLGTGSRFGLGLDGDDLPLTLPSPLHSDANTTADEDNSSLLDEGIGVEEEGQGGEPQRKKKRVVRKRWRLMDSNTVVSRSEMKEWLRDTTGITRSEFEATGPVLSEKERRHQWAQEMEQPSLPSSPPRPSCPPTRPVWLARTASRTFPRSQPSAEEAATTSTTKTRKRSPSWATKSPPPSATEATFPRSRWGGEALACRRVLLF